MMEAAEAFPPAPDATEADRAFGLMQRGDWTAARAAAEPLAEAGDGAMAALLARIHGEGLGVARDTATAMTWLERAASSGDRTARHDLALLHLTGEGVARDEPRALGLLRGLAGEGHAAASYDLAQALLTGTRTAAERAEGERALRAAADAGLPQALYALARFLDGSAVDALGDDEAVEALTHLVAAARSGLPEAQLELGVWLLTGRAGTRDGDAARVWLERAARAGLRPAAERLASLDASRRATALEGARARAPGLPGVRWEAPSRAAPAGGSAATGRAGRIEANAATAR